MAFPVDMLNNCSHEELESSAEDYLLDLRCGDPENPEHFPFLNNLIPISLSTVGFIPLYGGDQTHKVLALFAPEDSLTAVALFLADQWWAVDDIVKTSIPSREGLRQVSTLGERVVLYVLNRIIYRKREMERNEVPFLCHSSTDYAKILWKKGEAIGFYSVKPTGSMCTSYLTQSYQLPVLDTMFVRKKYRGKDLGLLMLEDFVDSFTEDKLGLRFPLSSFMHTACRQYFEKYPGDHDLLWEVEGTGQWHQRIPITSALQREAFRRTEVSQNEVRKLTYEDCDSAPTPEYEIGCGENQPNEMQVDPVRGNGISDTNASTSEGLDNTPINSQTRTTNLKRPKIGKRFHDSEINPLQDADENTPQASSVAPISRLESTAYTSESSEELVEDEPDERVVDFEQEKKDKEQHTLETQGLNKSVPEKKDDEEESELEPLNGEVMEDTIKASLKSEEDTTHDALDGNSKWPSGHSSEESGTLLVPPTIESTKAPEDATPDKATDVIDSKMVKDKSLHNEKESPEEKSLPAPRKKPPLVGSDTVATTLKEEPSDNGLSNSVVGEASEESVSDNVSPNTSSSLEDQGEDMVPDSQENPATTTLSQSAPGVVELEDIHSAGQKNQSEEQSEASSEPQDHFPQSAEKAADSSSEEVEVEVPVIDRRNLRRKAKAYKGPTKKKAKLA
ncbi:soluble lamin-associated protein of 75 kDa isoform X2 [Vombatus ursinus]|uniref:Family with sequence similarity 169 member A n=2 Tax=Vombatus ursinus TaxID=29139 RepID=A0A4X2LUF7_VOMUR|nr:soluble lamin-associated protein of 75 kDa isoform X2 [Vombatus ursinus]XP_027720047.1 soluble lamin-associated protein of 75 kDa isoform X2 [Vombatus ursinus]